ncbi:MAG: GtrA family protein [Fluviibacter sp.]|jgi:dolichol-phosphate mannosyltransferase
MRAMIQTLQALPLIGALFRPRFIKFGIVGASGVVVNLAVLYVGQEYLFTDITQQTLRLNLSLALAIFIATISNFFWNRRWTWQDRKQHRTVPVVVQFGQYALACWVGIAVQFGLTNLFALFLHYMVANLIAVVIASLFNFVANDFWTFGRLKMNRANRQSSLSE